MNVTAKFPNGMEKALTDHHLKKNNWLAEELIRGLKTLDIEVWVEEEPMQINTSFKTILHIKTKDGREYSAGLVNKINVVRE